jgi:hypothetical protein
LLALLVPAAPRGAAEPSDLAVQLKPFLSKHCISCHGEKVKKGDLRLDALSGDLSDEQTLATWKAVLARTRSGEMPPAKSPRPEKVLLESTLVQIEDALAEPEILRQKKEGRAVVRRLNRKEYENTLHDLLGIDAELASLLPDDSVPGGFDTVGDSLSISAVLLEKYLAAADAALDAVPMKENRVPKTIKRVQMKTSAELKPYVNSRDFVGETDDAAIIYNETSTPYHAREFFNSPPGRYIVRISAAAHLAPEGVVMRAYYGNFYPGQTKTYLAGFYDIPPGEGRVVEFPAKFVSRLDTVKPIPCGLGPIFTKGAINEYKGPGLALRWMELEGPLSEPWPHRGYALLYGSSSAESLLKKFLPKAFRRPATAKELSRYLAIYQANRKEGESFEKALRASYRAILCSPNFLLLQMNRLKASPAHASGQLDAHALATRLSYFLWSSCPDETLHARAADGSLLTEKGLREEVERMLGDAKAKRFTTSFTGQWLGLRDLDFTIPDAKLYPEYDDWLRHSMEQETYRFFDEILTHNRSLLEFIDSDWSILDGRLAQHYGITDVRGAAWRKVTLPANSKRGGVMTQASVLKVTANGTTTSPILRGAWVLDRILGTPAPAPPPNVPAVEPDIRGATKIRDQLAKHRTAETCASCHTRMDPPGFALENFDVIGGWRDRYRSSGPFGSGKNRIDLQVGRRKIAIPLGPNVEAADVLPDGRKFKDISEFKKLLLADPERIASALASKLITYSTGQPVGPADRRALAKIVRQIQTADGTEAKYGFRSLIHAIVRSELFQHK